MTTPAAPGSGRRPAGVHWFLPTNGDARGIVGSAHAKDARGSASGLREPTVEYLGDVARAADRLGYDAVLTPTGTWSEDAWLSTAAVVQQTERLKFLVALRPGLVSPTLAAQMAATLQRFSGGRVLLNVVTGGDEVELRRFGDWLDHDERYDRTAEFLEVLRGVGPLVRPTAPPSRSTTPGGTTASRGRAASRRPTRRPRSGSAGRPRRRSRSRPSTPTST